MIITEPLNIGQVLTTQARLQPNRIGARDLDRQMTFRQWNRRACQLANALTGLGLARGDRVAILAYNRVEWAEIFVAAAKAGLIAVPINFRLTGVEAQYIIENSGATALICEAALTPTIEAVRGNLDIAAERFILIGSGQVDGQWRPYENLLSAASDSEPDAAVHPDDIWCLMYTSGTTGRPKGAIRTHRGIAMLALMTCVELGLEAGRQRAAGDAHVPRQLAVLLLRLRLCGCGSHHLLAVQFRPGPVPENDGRDRHDLHLAGAHPLHHDAGRARSRTRQGQL
jgi:fatty-acyl-CoA synthase